MFQPNKIMRMVLCFCKLKVATNWKMCKMRWYVNNTENASGLDFLWVPVFSKRRIDIKIG